MASNAGLRKARRVRKLMAEGHSKTEARAMAGVKGHKKGAKKGAHKKSTKKSAHKKGGRSAALVKARKVRKYMAEGMSKTEARKKAGAKNVHKKPKLSHAARRAVALRNLKKAHAVICRKNK